MTTNDKPKKRRRARGTGGIFLVRNTWWISYRGPDGSRQKESSHSERKGDAIRLLDSRNGARIHHIPIVKNGEQLTFDEAAQGVIDDYAVNGKRSIEVVKRRIQKHLQPFFGGRRMAGITAADVSAYVAHRQKQGIERQREVPAEDGSSKMVRKLVRVADVSNAEINRELQALKRIFSLAMKNGLLAMRPHIALLREDNVRTGFFTDQQVDAVCKNLESEVADVVRFAFITAWRLHAEVLTLEWRNVNFAAGEVRLDPGRTKNREGRVFPITDVLRKLLKDRHLEHERLKQAGQIEPWVFWRMVAEGRGGVKKPRPIVSINKSWKSACVLAGLPGRIPHDLRRSAVRRFVRAGLSQSVAMKLSGHKTADVFRRYDIISENDLRDAASKLDAASQQPREKRSRSTRPRTGTVSKQPQPHRASPLPLA
jgi:integrase